MRFCTNCSLVIINSLMLTSIVSINSVPLASQLAGVEIGYCFLPSEVTITLDFSTVCYYISDTVVRDIHAYYSFFSWRNVLHMDSYLLLSVHLVLIT